MEESKPKRKTTTSTDVKRKYNEKTYERVVLDVKIGTKAEWQEKAQSEGKSLTKFISDCVDNAMLK